LRSCIQPESARNSKIEILLAIWTKITAEGACRHVTNHFTYGWTYSGGWQLLLAVVVVGGCCFWQLLLLAALVVVGGGGCSASPRISAE
jgi:hypothetical protein